jgi:hypothetical protein
VFRHEVIPALFPCHDGKKREGFVVNLISGCLATLLSSPFNYIRNIHYATDPSKDPDRPYRILQDLWRRARQEKTTLCTVKYVQSRLRIGWGTARVGCGMAFAAWMYEWLSTHLT